MITLFIDLETIKCQNKDHIDYIISKIKPHHACKTDEAKQKSIEKQKEEVIEKTVFDGAYGEIVTIGYALDDRETIALQRGLLLTEKMILQAFFDALKVEAERVNQSASNFQVRWVAHNKEFDFRYLYQRAVVNNINTHGIKIPVDARHGTKEAYCTMQAWKGFGAKAGGSLDSICKVLGLEGKKGFSGADVYGAWERGEYQRIADYCKDDVNLTRSIYKRLNFIRQEGNLK